jgi:phospholipase/carboxylesterase
VEARDVTLPLTGPSRPPASGAKKPKQAVIFLHGLGADGDDLIGLATPFAQALPDAEFLSPHAPFPCDMAPFGRQWFSLQDRNPERILAGLQAVRPVFDRYLNVVLESRELTEADVALVGFSQGTMLSLYGALRRPRPIAALAGFSGLFPHEARLDGEILSRPPVLLVHGEEDPVVDFASMDLAARLLAGLGVPVETCARPGLGHWIDDEGIARGIEFLVRGFTEKQAR